MARISPSFQPAKDLIKVCIEQFDSAKHLERGSELRNFAIDMLIGTIQDALEKYAESQK